MIIKPLGLFRSCEIDRLLGRMDRICIRAVVLAISFLAGSMVLQAQSERTKTYDVIRSDNVPAGLAYLFPEDLGALRSPSHPAYETVKSCVDRALADYSASRGHLPKDDLECAVAVTDWVARTLRHPNSYPKNKKVEGAYRSSPDSYLTENEADAFLILKYVLKFDPNDTEKWPSPFCDHQNKVAALLLNFQGIYCRLTAPLDHTGMEFFSRQLAKWVWCEATFNEHYVFVEGSGRVTPLSAAELHMATLQGQLPRVRVVKHGWPLATYLGTQPQGFRRYAVWQWMKLVGPFEDAPGDHRTFLISRDGPIRSTTDPWVPGVQNTYPLSPGIIQYPVVADASTIETPLDRFGLITPPRHSTEGLVLQLGTTMPFASRIEILMPGDKSWRTLLEIPVPEATPVPLPLVHLEWSDDLVRLRVMDTANNSSNEVILKLYQ